MSKKVHVLTRNPFDYQRETKSDIHKVARNPDASLHHFAYEREYVKAINTSKIQRFLAKPFVHCLDGASDDVLLMSADPKMVSLAAFGTADGRLEYWNISRNIKLFDEKFSDGMITGVSHFNRGNFLTCGSDKIVRHWDFKDEDDAERWTKPMTPLNSFTIDDHPRCLHTQLFGYQYAIGTNDSLLVYNRDALMTEPIARYSNAERQSVNFLRFHPTENDIIGALSSDNKITFYDTRRSGTAQLIKLTHRSNAISFNPTMPTMFTTASDDYNLYTFDQRYFKKPIKIHTGFVKAVNDVNYSRGGAEFVAGSVDKTIRIYNHTDSIAREIYTNKRQGRILNVMYTFDDQYILSSSADHNVRLWKAQSAAKLGAITPREQRSLREANKLTQKFANNPEVRKIQNRRRIPNVVKKLGTEHKIMESKRLRKERNRTMHAKPGTKAFPSKFERVIFDNQ